MRNIESIIVLAVILALTVGCGHHMKNADVAPTEVIHHGAHFPDMDTNGDDLVSWAEFKNKFPDVEKNIYETADSNKDGSLNHDEWHQFKSTRMWGE